MKHKEKNLTIPNTSTPNHHAQRNDATSVNLLNLQTTKKLPSVGKEYMCFQIVVKLTGQPSLLNPGS